MTNTAGKSWEKFLNPETLKLNLIAISLFITAYELFSDRIIEKPQIFFSNGLDEIGATIDEAYQSEVLTKSKSKLYASLIWLKEMEAIEPADIAIFDSIRQYRNELAHEPMTFLTSADRDFDPTRFRDLVKLLEKIEKWWVINYELSIDPGMLPSGANPDDIILGAIWSLQLMLEIALGTEPDEGFYFKKFSELIREHK